MNHEDIVQELWDREQIRELTYQYGLAIESQNADELVNLFTDKGSVDFSSLGRGIIRGPAAMKEFYTSTWPLEVKPFFTNHVIRVNGLRASGMCSLENRGVRGGESMIGAGRLHDEYEKVDGKWKFVSRRVEMFYFVPLIKGWAGDSGLGQL